MVGGRLLRAPGERPGEPAGRAAAARGTRAPRATSASAQCDVVDHEHARPLAAGRVEQDACHAVEESRLRARPVERRRRRRAELGHEPRRLARPAPDRPQPAARRERAAHELDRAAEREAGLAPRRSARDVATRAAATARLRDELFGEPRLADPRLAFEDDEPAVRADRRRTPRGASASSRSRPTSG